MNKLNKVLIIFSSLLVAIIVGATIVSFMPQHTEYYVKNDDGTETQIAVVSEDKHSGKKNVYLSTYDKVYNDETDTAIDWSIELSADYVCGSDVQVNSRKLPFWEKPKLMKINR